MSSSRTLSRKFRTFFICIKPRFDPSIILLYIAASVEQYCDITQVNALPENEGILEADIIETDQRIDHNDPVRVLPKYNALIGQAYARGTKNLVRARECFTNAN